MDTDKKKQARAKEAERLDALSKSSAAARWERDKLCSTDRNIMDASVPTKKKTN